MATTVEVADDEDERDRAEVLADRFIAMVAEAADMLYASLSIPNTKEE